MHDFFSALTAISSFNSTKSSWLNGTFKNFDFQISSVFAWIWISLSRVEFCGHWRFLLFPSICGLNFKCYSGIFKRKLCKVFSATISERPKEEGFVNFTTLHTKWRGEGRGGGCGGCRNRVFMATLYLDASLIFFGSQLFDFRLRIICNMHHFYCGFAFV